MAHTLHAEEALNPGLCFLALNPSFFLLPLQEVLRGMKSAMARLLHAEEALAPTCTCMACMGILVRPVLLVPCGHIVCQVKREGGRLIAPHLHMHGLHGDPGTASAAGAMRPHCVRGEEGGILWEEV